MRENDAGSRWGGVARGRYTESSKNPQQISGSDFRTLQDRAALSVNDARTCEISDTPLTQPRPIPFAGRSADLLRVAAVQLPRLDPEDRAALLPYVQRDMAKVTK